MSAKKIYKFDIEAQDIDFRRRVSLRSLTNMVLIAAGKNADENGFGLLELQTEHYTWVLSRLVVDMERIPTEQDTLSVETWIEHVGTAFTTRNFRLRDGSGTVIGHAKSSWAIIDMRTRRSVRLDTIPSMQEFVVHESIPVDEPARIANVEGEVANSFTVKYSDIDVNTHTNSLNYVQWVSDCFSLDFYRTHYIRRFEINFLKEITFGDSGEVYRQQTEPNDYIFQIETKEKGAACRARILFEDAPK
ncbi:acyl-[acyl-carrier-protein] thioesterase [Proteiniphilum sp.]|uniref:acyl-[acyl-carrier-protein] thioesterase n=1 Tax=Proteiniphilum sp. TaxID=1926877 RepID=UPI002B20E7F0|nr:acyl-ACP thioesterase domain-containing protein [Proteiniphilum sp.]MEA4916126.1 thioesterase [Proteiniphilum sp.]